MTTIREYVDTYMLHGTSCSCDVCITVRKWHRDIEGIEMAKTLRESGKV